MQNSLRDSTELFKNCLRIKLNLNTAYFPQTDGQSERTIQTSEGMIKVCVFSVKGKLGLSFALKWNSLK